MLEMPTIACNRPVTSLAPYVILTHMRNQEANACIGVGDCGLPGSLNLLLQRYGFLVVIRRVSCEVD